LYLSLFILNNIVINYLYLYAYKKHKNKKNNVVIMKIVLINPVKSDLFALIFQHIKTFTEYINISFQKKGMYIQSMDSSHISIFEVNLPFSWFDEYIL
jgi:hypothetical protein